MLEIPSWGSHFPCFLETDFKKISLSENEYPCRDYKTTILFKGFLKIIEWLMRDLLFCLAMKWITCFRRKDSNTWVGDPPPLSDRPTK